MREERQQKATLLAEFGNPAQKAHRILPQLYFSPESGRSLSAVASRKSACWARADFQELFRGADVVDDRYVSGLSEKVGRIAAIFFSYFVVLLPC